MRTLLMISITALCLGNATAQSTPDKVVQPAIEQAPLKDHACTAACTDGHHVYAHGEKGHVCSAECMQMNGNDAMLKDHVCTAACTDGNHVHAHGEEVHVRDANCKGAMKMEK